MLAPEDDLELLNNEGEIADESKFSSFFLGPTYNTIKEIVWATGTVVICLCVAALIFTYTEREWQVMDNKVDQDETETDYIDHEKVKSLTRIYDHINTSLNANVTEMANFSTIARSICATKKHAYDYEWHFGGAMDYVIALLTTTGWGTVVPKTSGGKFFTFVYLIGGIPIMMLFLHSLTDFIDTFFTSLREHCSKKIAKIESKPDGWALYVVSTILFSLSTFMVLVMAGISVKRTHKWDISGADLVPQWAGDGKSEWQFWDAFYYQVISLFTIGFGDFHHSAYDGNFGAVQYFFGFIPICLFLGLSRTVFNQFKEKRCTDRIHNEAAHQ